MADLNSYINIGANSVEAVTVSATGDITTSQNIGATGDLNVGGNIDVDGNTAIGGNLFVTGNINFTGNVTQISGNSGVFFGDPATGVGALYAGKTGYTPLPSTILQVTGDENAYIQTNFQNTNHGNTASMEVAITADDGTDITNYIDMGIAGSTWDGTQDNSLGTAVARRDGYLYVQGGSAGGNLVLGTTTAGYAVKFNAGGPGSANTVAQISNTGISTSGTVSASGNITANYLFGNAAFMTGIPASYGNSNVTTLLAGFGSNTISTTGNITAGNVVLNGNLTVNGSPIYGVPASYTKYTRSSQQTGLSNGSVVIFNVLENSFGSDISVNTGTGQVTLAANRTYRLVGMVPGFTTSGSDVRPQFCWYNETTSSYIGNSAEVYTPNSSAGYGAFGGPAEAVVVTNATTVVSFRLLAGATNLAGIGGNPDFNTTGSYPWIDIQVIGGQAPITGFSTVGNVTGGNVLTAGVVSAAGNVTGNYILGNGSQLTGLPATYSDSNVTTLLAAYGSNTVSTTGNITSGNLKTNNNLIFTANTSNIVFNNTAYINGSGNAVGRDGSIMLVPYTGAGSTFPGVVIGGAGRLIAPNGSVHQILNASDVTFQVPIKTTSTAATSTTTGAVQVAGGVGVVGNIYAGGLASVTGNVAGSNILTAGVVSATGNVTAGNISTAGLISAGGNVTAQNFIGNISITGNVTGTSANVTLVAGSYSYVFDNVGTLTVPAGSGSGGGSEGGQINFAAATANTTMTGPIAIDIYQDKMRFFETAGTNRGVYLDLAQAATSVGTLLNNRVSSAGLALNTSLAFDNLAIQIKTQSSGVWIFAGTVTGTATYQYSITYQLVGSAANGTIGTMSATTTQATLGSSAWYVNTAANSATVILTDTTNSKTYRVTWQTTTASSPYGNYVSIERIV